MRGGRGCGGVAGGGRNRGRLWGREGRRGRKGDSVKEPQEVGTTEKKSGREDMMAETE